MLFSCVFLCFAFFCLCIAEGFLHLHVQGYLAATKFYTCSWPKQFKQKVCALLEERRGKVSA